MCKSKFYCFKRGKRLCFKKQTENKSNNINMGKISITYNGGSILIESGKKNLTITAEQAYYLKEMLSDIDSKYNLRPQIQNK